MKIIHIITAFGIGGAEKLLLNVINKQVEEHSVHLIYLKPIDDLIPLVDERVYIKNIPLSPAIIKHIKKYLINSKPDIVHTHLGHADILGIWSAKNIEAKVFCTMHNIYFKKNFLDVVFFEIYKLLFLRVVKNGHIISISKSVENHVLNKLRIPKNRSHLLANAIPLKPPPEKKENSEKVNVLFVGRLEKQKSLETLLRAVKYLKTKKLKKEFNLIIVGDGKLRNKLEHLTKELLIDNIVRFDGEQKNVDSYYKQADIFVLPSIWEGFGIVILEAFSAKLAVIASNVEGPAELISHNENGLLFEAKNHIQLAERITELINNEVKRHKIALNGYDTFTQKYHIDIYVEKLNQLYKNA